MKNDAASCFLDRYNFSSLSAQAPAPSVYRLLFLSHSVMTPQIQCSTVLVFGYGSDGDDSSELRWVWEEWERLRGRERGYGFRINNLSLNNTLYFPRVPHTNSLVTLSIQEENIFFFMKAKCVCF